MLHEEPPQLSLADAEALRESIDARLIESTQLDERQRARDGIRCPAPGAEIGRGFGSAAQARAKACLLRRGRGRIENHVLGTRRSRRTDRAAVNPGRLDAGKEAPVKTCVA